MIIENVFHQSDNSCIPFDGDLDSEETQPNQAAAITKGVFLSITVILSLAFNTLCLMVLPRVRSRSLNHVTKIFMISFTMCDLFGITVVYIPMTVATFYQKWPFGNALCVINGFCSTIFAYTTGIQLVALNLERYLAITYPLRWYNIYVTPKRAKVAVAALWISAIAFSSIAYCLPDRYTYYNHLLSICTSNPCGDRDDISGSIFIVLFTFSPVLLTFIFWLRLYLIARRHATDMIAQVHSVGSTPPATPPPTPSVSIIRKTNKTSSGVDNPSFSHPLTRSSSTPPSTPPGIPSPKSSSRKSDPTHSYSESFTHRKGFSIRKLELTSESVTGTPPGTPPPSGAATRSSCRKPDQSSLHASKSSNNLSMHLINRALQDTQVKKVEQAMIKANRRAFFTFCLMSICLSLTSLPFITVLMYDNMRQVHVLPHAFVAVSQLLVVSFGFLNVLIYYARNTAFRKTAKKLFFKHVAGPSDPYRN